MALYEWDAVYNCQKIGFCFGSGFEDGEPDPAALFGVGLYWFGNTSI